MPLNNLGGANQFGGFELQPGYGDVKKQTALTREAPMSGSPIAAHAIDQPKQAGRAGRAGRQGTVAPRQSAATGAAGPAAGPSPVAPPTPEAQAAQVWQAIAQTPGASPLVQQYAAQAASGG